MKKKLQAGLTQELMEKLSQDAYCFNLEHDNEISKLKEEIARLTKVNEESKKETSAQVSKAKDENSKIVGDIESNIQDLRDDILKLQEEKNTLYGLVNELEAKGAGAKEEARKELRKEGKCFDFMHKMIDQRKGHILTIPEFFAMGLALMYKGPPGVLNYADNITVYIDPRMSDFVDVGKKLITKGLKARSKLKDFFVEGFVEEKDGP